MQRFLAYLLPFLAVAVTHMVLQALLSVPLGPVWSSVVAGVVTLTASLMAIAAIRRAQGRLSQLAFTLVSASCIAVVLPAAHLARAYTGGNSPLMELLIAVIPAMALLVALEMTLYTHEEVRALRSNTFGKKPESERK
jgi:K+ transporter